MPRARHACALRTAALLLAGRATGTVEDCKRGVRGHLERAGNEGDPAYAMMVCDARHLPRRLAPRGPRPPPSILFERLLCDAAAAKPDAKPPRANIDAAATLGKFFWQVATHPRFSDAPLYNFDGWNFLPRTGRADDWFRPACLETPAGPPQPKWQPGILWWTSASLDMRLRLVGPRATAARDALLRGVSTGTGRAVAVHIRRGDACQVFGGPRVEGTRRCFDTATYVDAARELKKRYPALTVLRVATDSPSVLREVEALAPEWTIEALRFDRGNVGGPENATLGLSLENATRHFIEHRRDRPDATLALASFLADLELLGSAHAFVGTWSATVSRLVLLTQVAHLGFLPPFIFLDGPNDRRAWGPRRGRLGLFRKRLDDEY